MEATLPFVSARKGNGQLGLQAGAISPWNGFSPWALAELKPRFGRLSLSPGFGLREDCAFPRLTALPARFLASRLPAVFA